MKQTLRFAAFLMLMLPAFKSQSQVTQLSNNTNIRVGMALGSIGVLVDKNGGLWKTDGTETGTVKYTNKVIVDSNLSAALLNNEVYFSGFSAESGQELWVTDGTDDGTYLVKDIKTGAGSSAPRTLYVFNNMLYFFAKTTESGVELWRSDGTSDGTSMVKDINPGTAGSSHATDTAFFASNNILYFNANDGSHGTELWKTNGTDEGTVMVKDINPGEGSSACQNFATLGTNLIFSADDGSHGAELWKSNGTDVGTSLIQDIAPGSSSPQQLVSYNSKTLFLVLSGPQFPTFKLYSTDGNSVTLAQDFGPGGFAILANSVVINDKLIFGASTPTGGSGIWSSDGTLAGTTQVKQVNPIGGGVTMPVIFPDFLSFINGGDYHTALYNGKIIFLGDDGSHGGELWITDGTQENTTMIKDLRPGTDSSVRLNSLSWFYTANTFYFAANDGTTGNELFKTGGTEASTALVANINPGGAGSNPFLFMFLNSHVYFTANNGDGDGATDLYLIDEEVVLPVTLVDFNARLNGKAVDLNWTTSTETNTRTFVIQRSSDAIHFDNIGNIAAAGNSSTKKDYSFIDAGAFNSGAKVLYYRLQIADNDGKLSNSKIAKVEVTADNNRIAVYPNPVKDKLNIITGKSLNNAIIKISDQSGKMVMIQKIPMMQAGEKTAINVTALGKGIYYLQLITDNNKQITQFIKY